MELSSPQSTQLDKRFFILKYPASVQGSGSTTYGMFGLNLCFYSQLLEPCKLNVFDLEKNQQHVSNALCDHGLSMGAHHLESEL